ncbi:hypothetical protein, partial [Bacillus cereus]|uniref:hypothetical protein n=1 Tax=Bacillus cereus TaxID=1396 RepID=UPI000BF71BBE
PIGDNTILFFITFSFITILFLYNNGGNYTMILESLLIILKVILVLWIISGSIIINIVTSVTKDDF